MNFNISDIRRQTDTIMEILCHENDPVTFINYYLEVDKIVREYLTGKAITVSDMMIYGIVWNAARSLVRTLSDADAFIKRANPRDLCEALKSVLAEQLEEIIVFRGM